MVTVGKVIRGKVGFHQRRVIHRHFYDVQDVEPIPILILGDSEKLLDGSVHSLGLHVGLGMEST